MNIYASSALCFSVCSFFIGAQVLFKRKDKVGCVYFILSCLYFTWGLGYGYLISNRFDAHESLFWIRVANGVAVFIPIVWIHFCFLYSETNAPKYFFLAYGLPALILPFIFSELFLPSLKPILNFSYYPNPGPLCNLHMILYICGVPMGFWLLIMKGKALATDERKRLFSFILIAFLGYLGGGLAFLPVYDIPFPQFGLFLLPLYPFGLSYFMNKDGVLTLESIAALSHKDKLAALGILTASINHEIRGPLFAMRGAVETQEDSEELKPKLLNQIDRLTSIVSRLTHFAKKGVDEVAKIERLDLKEILSDIRPLLQHQFNYQNIRYEQNIAPNLPPVLADRRYLEEILFNLLMNACQALKERTDGQVTLNAQFKNHVIHIELKDNGPGISKGNAKKIFKPFCTSKAEGIGLGLYITKQLVEKCGGRIEVTSNMGAQFVLTLKAI